MNIDDLTKPLHELTVEEVEAIVADMSLPEAQRFSEEVRKARKKKPTTRTSKKTQAILDRFDKALIGANGGEDN